MFELSVAAKYLIPKKKQLSVSLIALMSVTVISLVVWLVLVFLSVTEGIERGWLEKLTALNAPMRITPTAAYHSSYYYLVDSLSSAANYSSRTIGEKWLTERADPYDADIDMEIPRNWPDPDRNGDGSLKDPVKLAFNILNNTPGIIAQDFEASGALMRLQLLRPDSTLVSSRGDESQSFLTQASYVASFADKSPYLKKLLIPPSARDLNHLFFLANHNQENTSADSPTLSSVVPKEILRERFRALFENIGIKELKTSLNYWRMPHSFLPKNTPFYAVPYIKNGQIAQLVLPHDKSATVKDGGMVVRQGEILFFKDKALPSKFPLYVQDGMHFKAELIPSSLEQATQLKDVRFKVASRLQGFELKGDIAWDGLEIANATVKDTFAETPAYAPPWSFAIQKSSGKVNIVLPIASSKEAGVLLAKSFQDSGVQIGDRGYLSYSAATSSSVQEQRLPIYVAGFYDPGIMAVGTRCILAPPSIVRAINGTSNAYNLDRSLTNGIHVWFKDLGEAEKIKGQLQAAFAAAGIDAYWKIQTFREYDFAKDLLEQFQSDKYLFALVGIIILTVACCNIISLLVLLVNDKKREIGILQAMGAPSRSIAAIFGCCGAAMGIASSLIGTLAALLTLHNIDAIVGLLSFIQGHEAFNAAFYGKSLPNHLSSNAMWFILIATPLLSLCAGLVPAIKACRLKPADILRSE